LITRERIGENFYGPRALYTALQMKACDYDNLQGYARLTADLKTPVQGGRAFAEDDRPIENALLVVR
jgi:hypothetical protein